MAKTQAVKPRNRKAQEATLINVDALKKRVARLEKRMKEAEDWIKDLDEDRMIGALGYGN